MDKATKNQYIIKEVKNRLFLGQITLSEAKAELAPIVAEMNKIGAELAIKYGVKPKIINVTSILR